MKVPKNLLLEADKDENLAGFVYPERDLERVSIKYEEKIVGFATPRQDKDGVWRMGAIYITPKYRRKGLVTKAIKQFMKNRNGRAFIENENLASQKAYSNAGFQNVRTGKDNSGSWWENYF